MLVLPKRAYHKTTNSHHRFRRHPNLLKDTAAKVVPRDSLHESPSDVIARRAEAQTIRA
jgi:hypothetical protein